MAVNYDLCASAISDRCAEIDDFSPKLGEFLSMLGQAKKDLYLAEKSLEEEQTMLLYRESLKKESALNASNAEARKLAKDAFLIEANRGALKPLADRMQSLIVRKMDLEGEVAKYDKLLKALEIAQLGDIAVLGSKR